MTLFRRALINTFFFSAFSAAHQESTLIGKWTSKIRTWHSSLGLGMRKTTVSDNPENLSVTMSTSGLMRVFSMSRVDVMIVIPRPPTSAKKKIENGPEVHVIRFRFRISSKIPTRLDLTQCRTDYKTTVTNLSL